MAGNSLPFSPKHEGQELPDAFNPPPAAPAEKFFFMGFFEKNIAFFDV
jgi:hypothetical protein